MLAVRLANGKVCVRLGQIKCLPPEIQWFHCLFVCLGPNPCPTGNAGADVSADAGFEVLHELHRRSVNAVGVRVSSAMDMTRADAPPAMAVVLLMTTSPGGGLPHSSGCSYRGSLRYSRPWRLGHLALCGQRLIYGSYERRWPRGCPPRGRMGFYAKVQPGFGRADNGDASAKG